MAAGYAAGVSIEVKDEKMTNRSRKIKFFLDKMKAQENQTDSVAKLVKDLIVRKAITWVKAAAPIIGLVLLLLVLVVAMIAVPVIAVIAILYNSPFALFLPPLESGDTVQTVTSAYVQEFNRDVNTKVNEHTGYDLGELVYVDYEGMEENPSNYYDIMAVYMVKHGIGDTATVMNDISKGWLQAVVNDMCSYTTSTGTKDVEETDADGNVTTVTKSVLYVNVTLKSYRDMISVYGFNSDQVEMLEQIMSPEFMGQLGYAGSGSGGGGGSPGVSSMTEDEINAILSGITDSRQKTVCSYALHRVGFPYSQDLRDSGNYYDCSSLAYYSWKDAGVDISFGGATTAAAEAQGLDEAGKTVSFDELQPGDLINYMVLQGKTEYKAELSTSPVGSMVKLENLFNGLHENIDFLEKKIEQYQNDLEASKTEYDKPFAYSKELEEKLARQCELNAQLDLENAKAVDADLSGPEEEREADDRMESAAIVAEDKGAYPADREGRTR